MSATLRRDASGTLRHPYTTTDDGGCVCGLPLVHRWHAHEFAAAEGRVYTCVCGLPKGNRQHREAQ